MMTKTVNLTFSKIEANDVSAVYDFLVGSTWDFHGPVVHSLERVQKRFDKGFYESDDVKSFWIETDRQKIGMIRLFDLGNVESRETPLFDLRVATAFRGLGIGSKAVAFLTRFVFENYPNKNRIEATTRIDNKAMRGALAHCGYVKEAHYRQAWKTESGYMDCIAYGMLKSDWERGCCTIVDWES